MQAWTKKALWLAAVLAPAPLTAQIPPSGDIAAATKPWLYAGSDIPVDPAWRFGTLPNGLRYAVRRNALPEHSISIRVRVDAGALIEREDEQGYAHFMEHMAFRGTREVPDGEGARIWQRLGANFGTDTNAYTTQTQTVYAIDLAKADAASLDTGLHVAVGMMQDAQIDPKALDIERKVVIAERDLRLPPLRRRIQDVMKATVMAGTRAASTEVTGTDATLAAVTAPRLRAFYERWYRPERTTVVIVGDADPAMLEAAVASRFGEWRATGPVPTEPDYGKPAAPLRTSAIVSDPQATSVLTLFWPSPHDDRPWTVARQQAADMRDIAAHILSRRFTRKARDGAAFLDGGAGFDETRHTLDLATVSLAPKAGMWPQALAEAYGLLADAIANPPSQSEIDREVAIYNENFRALAAGMATAKSPALANLMVTAVDNGDVVADPAAYAKIFADERAGLTPRNVGATMRTMFAGDARAVLLSPQPVVGGETALAAALMAGKRAKATARAEQKKASLDALGVAGTPGKIVSRTTIADLGITRVRFANGVELAIKPTAFENDSVFVQARVGNGVAALDPHAASPTWTAPAIIQSGIGPWDVEGLEQAVNGHRLGLAFGIDESAFTWSGKSDRTELRDQLRLIVTAVREPRFDASVLTRMVSSYSENYDSLYATPGSVFAAFATPALHGGDRRFGAPTRDQIGAITPERLRSFWQPLFAGGARKVVIVGDVDLESAITAVQATFGAVPTTPAAEIPPSHLEVLPPVTGTAPLTLEHRGDPDQLFVASVWPTTGVLGDLAQSRALNVASKIFSTRLFERFRESEGGAYTPTVTNEQSLVFARYGVFTAASQLRAERAADFARATREIATDLATKGPAPDELARAVTPIVSSNQRGAQTNGFWASMLERNLDDPRVIEQMRTVVSGYQAVDAAAVQAVAAKWLAGPPALTVIVKGRPKPAKP